MAEIQVNKTGTGGGGAGTVVYTWETLTETDTTGSTVVSSSHPDKTVTVTGTFGGTTVTIQGSNDGTNWFTMTNPQGNNVSLTAAGMELLAENPIYIRPSTSGGTGVDVDIIIVCRNNN